jgi:hypothetical protein
MSQKARTTPSQTMPSRAQADDRDGVRDVTDLLHPARAFAHPSNVVNDPDLTLNEKRAILASWASDACAIEAAPDLRSAPTGRPVRFDDIMDALRTLDKQASGDKYRRIMRRNQILRRDRRDDWNGGAPLQ